MAYYSTFLQAQHTHCTTPAAPYLVTVTQPNGQELQVRGRGDAFNNWTETEDGYAVVKNQAGYYEYATSENGKLVASGITAASPTERSIAQQRQLLSIRKGIPQTLVSSQGSAVDQLLPIDARARSNAAAVVPTQGDVKILAILIEYPDLKHKYKKEDFEKLFNGPSDQPTFKSYFQRNSHGKFNPTVEVAGWFQAKNNYEYYGEKYGKGRARELVAEAIDAANKSVDFSEFNNDGKGNIDGVIIVHSGPGAEEGGNKDYVWSHRSTISAKFVDGEFLQDYTIQPEIRVRNEGIVGIGIFCHEFGHLLGLPDLYDTDTSDDRHYGIGEWGLMGLGGWLGKENHPAGMSAFSKEALGWARVQDITEKTGKYTLNPAHSSGEIYKIATPNDNEYFLLENRQKQATDKYLNGSGLAVWHIDSRRTSRYPASNTVNTRRDFKGVDLEEADGQNDLDFKRNRGDEGDLFPGSSKRTEFDEDSDPSSDLYEDQGNGKESEVAITNIQLSSGIISFNYGNTDDESGNEKTDPALAVETVPTKTYGDNSFDLKVTFQGEGEVSFERVSGPIELSGKQISITGAGTARVKVTVTETDKFTAAEQEIEFQINKATPAIAFTEVTDKTYGDAPFTLQATSTPDFPVSYKVNQGGVTIANNTVTITEAGEVEIEASVAGNNKYNGAKEVISFVVQKASQTIEFDELDDVVYEANKEIRLTATSDQNLPITFSVVEGGVNLAGQTLVVQRAGKVTIEASQAGNKNFATASVQQSFEVTKAPQIITFTEIEDKAAGDEPFALEATSNADIPVTFTLVSGNATLNDNQVTLTGSGEVIIEASNEGNENYLAEQERLSFVVAEPGKQNQVITLGALPDTVKVGEVVDLEISVSSELNLDIDVAGTAVRNGQSLTFTQAGEVTLTIAQPGNNEYNPARTVTHTFVVVEPSEAEKPLGVTTQTITYQEPEDLVFGDAPFPLSVESSSKLPLTYEVEGPAEISNGTVTITGAGEVTVRAFQVGDEEYAPSDTVAFSFTISKAAQAITLAVAPTGTNTFQVQASSDAGLPVTLRVSEGEGTLSGDTLIAISPKIMLVASQEGNTNYEAAEPVTRELTTEVITSLGGEISEKEIVVYPNPGEGIFKVRLKKEQKSVPYQVFDLRGAVVTQGTLRSANPAIDLADQRSGTYFLQLQLLSDTKQYRLIKL
ncbi:M6 family metalloprotease domain-containing protein [Tunicatimonas pelagia]|uniref:M6 family metalloprotease domain-containing protein n=1 Tax=Tunicatimonas pelagia TaxID=931531 RepID=UPI002666ABCA|nr:M6 family metalloprotease domain-containing protein [Tunicatimonas pelagia]WKN43424.1 M6 family metalloprotease domain-containing protein [Tunicatimonas pelagia]